MANKELTSHLDTMTSKVASLETKISSLEVTIDKLITLSARKSPYDRNSNHYCWTHGACNHQSAACNQPHANHGWHANFRDRMGGNPAGCWT